MNHRYAAAAMKYHVRKARLIDLILARENMRDIDAAAINAFAEKDADLWAAKTLLKALAIWAMQDVEGKVIGVAGVNEVRENVVEVWAVGTKYLDAEGMIVAGKFLEGLFNDILNNTSVHRIECYVMENFMAGHRTIRRFGFIEEGFRRGAGVNGENAVAYARRKT